MMHAFCEHFISNYWIYILKYLKHISLFTVDLLISLGLLGVLGLIGTKIVVRPIERILIRKKCKNANVDIDKLFKDDKETIKTDKEDGKQQKL